METTNINTNDLEGLEASNTNTLQTDLANDILTLLRTKAESGNYSPVDLIASMAMSMLTIVGNNLEENAEVGTLFQLGMQDSLQLKITKLDKHMEPEGTDY